MIRSFGLQELCPVLNTNNWEQTKDFVGARADAWRSARKTSFNMSYILSCVDSLMATEFLKGDTYT